MGVLTAAGATGQLIFLPVMAWLTERYGWRAASLVVTVAALAVVPFVVLVLRDYPEDLGVTRTAPRRVGRNAAITRPEPRAGRCAPGRRGTDQDVLGAGRWLCHLRRHHQRSDRHPLRALRPRPRHAETTAAGLLALVGIFESSARSPPACSPTGSTRACCWPSTTSSAVSVCWCCPGCCRTPCTPACSRSSSSTGWTGWRPCRRRRRCAEKRSVVRHDRLRLGVRRTSARRGLASAAAGIIRDTTGQYTLAWFGGAGLCLVAAIVSVAIRGRQRVST